MKIKVLVTGAGGDAGIGVIKALRRFQADFEITSTCIRERSAGLLMSDYHEIAPPVCLGEAYIDFLRELIRTRGIQILIPTVDSELLLLSRFADSMAAETGCQVIIGTRESVEICCDKFKTQDYLKRIGVGHPSHPNDYGGYCAPDKNGAFMRVIKKPRFGAGSKGIEIFDTSRESVYLNSAEFIFQVYEYYSVEYTAAVMKNGKDIAAVAVFERNLEGGRTVWCKRVPVGPHLDVVTKVAKDLDIPYLNVQFGMTEQGPSVFDLNPRFSGSTALFSRVFNGPELLAKKFFTGCMPEFELSPEFFSSVRYYDDFIYERYIPNQNEI